MPILKTLTPTILTLLALLTAACADNAPPTPTAAPTVAPDLGATVQAAVSTALPQPTPTPTPNLDATVDARMAATMAALPTPTPTPAPTPNLDATVDARMAATIAAIPTPTPTPRPTPTPTPAASLSDIVNQARPAVVRITTNTGTGTGTGAIFDTQGQIAYIITNHHIIEDASRVTVVVNDSTNYTGTVLGIDSTRDLAVIRICCGRFHKLDFGDPSRLKPGDEIIAIGYALGIRGPATITRGIVSALRYIQAIAAT